MEGQTFNLNQPLFVCDALARAFVKGIAGHNSKMDVKDVWLLVRD